MSDTVDVIVLGMGPGGEHAAGRFADAGLSVLGIDGRLVGGECPYYGCIPTKMMVRAADAVAEARRLPLLAGRDQVTAEFAPVARRIRDEATDDWDDRVAVERFTKKGGRFVRGFGRLTGPRTVRVGDREFTAGRAVVINTGTDPVVPPIPGLARTPYWTNREAVRATEAPESLLVIGGGTIGVELGQVFARFGTAVTIVEPSGHLLPREEPEAAEVLAGVLAAEGVSVRTGASAESVAHDGVAFTVRAGGEDLTAEKLLVATGRRSDLAGIGLDAIGLDTAHGSVDPDERMSIADGVYAIGDITGKGAFTHISMYQAEIAARAILGEPGTPAEYHAVPRVTFTDPEIGAVGLTERQARDAGLAVRTGTVPLVESTRGFIHGPGNDGVIKLVEDPDRGVLVGATSAGPSGGEMLGLLALAVHAEIPTTRLRQMIFAYPTFHRTIESALASLG